MVKLKLVKLSVGSMPYGSTKEFMHMPADVNRTYSKVINPYKASTFEA